MTPGAPSEIARLDSILTGEISLLKKLIELCRSLCKTDVLTEEVVRETLDGRDSISKELEALEAEVSSILTVIGSVPDTLRAKADSLIALSDEAKNAQDEIAPHLEKALKIIKKDTAEIANLKRGIRGYGGPVSHLSRFSDRKG